jgi:predicted glycosyltransferase
MRVWVDVVNSPQVLFFRPIIAELVRRQHDVFVTSRDFAQTVPLASQYGLAHAQIGHHGGRRWLSIVRRTLGRALALVSWARRQPGIDLAVSHNSYSQGLAAALLRVPSVTLMDYEHQPANHLCFRLARRVIVPEVFPDEWLDRYGATRKAIKYPGLKEQVYLSDFSPSPDFRREQRISDQRVVIPIRPPAPWAPYHRFENTLFDDVLADLASRAQTYIVFLPRIPAQADAARRLGYPNLWIPRRALNGPDLLYHADLVVSGGGTMNREAAVLGTPTYTVFKGRLGAVDRYLIERDRMVQVSELEDIGKIHVEKRNGHATSMHAPTLVGKITDLILEGS